MRNLIRSYLLTDAPAILQKTSTIVESTIIAKSGVATNIKRALYSDPYEAGPDEGNQSRVIDKLNEWYYSKCAYCERFYKLDVEHFRPKGEIRGEDNSLTNATGYYWLAYEWSNLLPSCISCNREGGKNSKFPYIRGGKIVAAPVYDASGNLDRTHCQVDHHLLIGELPALLNPETDLNIENYFAFEIDQENQGIRITGVDAGRRGEVTIKVCKLNRQEVRRDRLQNVVMDLIGCIHISIKRHKLNKDNQIFVNELNLYFEKIHEDCNDDKLSHTLLRKYIVASSRNFDKIVVPFVNAKFHTILSQAFKHYLFQRAIKLGTLRLSSLGI